MGFSAIAHWVVLAVIAGQPTAAAQPTKLSEPITTRQNVFAIPFRIERADAPQREPAEVQLYVSSDRGKTWQLSAKLEPAERQFLFRSPSDGEYWFAVRTLDRSGQVRPAGVPCPELRVVVDTVPPVLSLDAKVGQGGQITARWQVQESNPKLDTLNIQYRTDSTEPWQTVAINRREGPTPAASQSGEATWVPDIATGPIEIRADISDAAGNSAVSHAQVQLDKVAMDAVAADPNRVWRPVAGSPAAPSYRTTDWEAGGSAVAPADALTSQDSIPTTSLPMVTSPSVDPPSTAVAAKVNPPFQAEYDEKVGPAASAPAVARDWPYWVNKRVFDLKYDVQSVGPSGLGRVEVWGTRDAGRSWQCFAVDNDNVSPVSVGVDAEGVYGFRVVMQSRSGAGGQPPKSGDSPELWIGVDWTRPIVKILSTQQGSGADCGTLEIAWHATDQNIAPRTVSLAYSEQPSGPFTPIASGQESSGRYVWTLPQQLSPQVTLRIEASDMAGNVGVCPSEAVHLNPMRVSPRSSVVPPPMLPMGQPAEASRPTPKRLYFK